eukprot:gene9802-7691_t
MSSAISQFFILSARGDAIIRRDFLGNVPGVSSELFFRHNNFWKGGHGGLGEGEAPPVFIVDGVTYFHLKEGGVTLLATTRDNVSPSMVLELLRRLSTLIKDYCGFLTEESVRKNFPLIYELLDEVLDYGVPQSTSTDFLKPFVLNEPIIAKPAFGPKQLFSLNKGPTGVFKSVLDTNRTDGKHKEEIYVDVVERLTATFNASGHVCSSQVEGAIQIKSYLTWNPPIKLKLNDGMIIGRRDNKYGGYPPESGGHAVYLNDASFHEVANLDAFDTEKCIILTPPDGEFALMNYRTTVGFKPPFRVYMTVEADPISVDKATVTMKIWCEIPPEKAASGLEVELPTPKYVQRVHCELDEKAEGFDNSFQSWDYSEKGHVLKWRLKRIGGGQDFMLRARLTLDRPYLASLRSEIGPINLRFTIPMYALSRLAIKYLQILKKEKNYNPCRWVRYVTTSNSYTFRT